MHPSTFLYLNPTDGQLECITRMRETFAICASCIEAHVPEGPDRTYLLRQLRDCAMWANVAITRHADGSPRTD